MTRRRNGCAVVAREGPSGQCLAAYTFIDERVVDDLLHRPALHHAANFSPPIAFNIARRLGIRAYLLIPSLLTSSTLRRAFQACLKCPDSRGCTPCQFAAPPTGWLRAGA